jgi:hypothetical protein
MTNADLGPLATGFGSGITPTQSHGSGSWIFENQLQPGKNYRICVKEGWNGAGCLNDICSTNDFVVGDETKMCDDIDVAVPLPNDPGGVTANLGASKAFNLCGQIGSAERAKGDSCCRCQTGSANSHLDCSGDGSSCTCTGSSNNGATVGLWTAVGCIPTTYQGITGTLLKIGLMVGGGAGMLMILGAALVLATSEGEQKKINDAKDQITAAIIGLVFIIFSITILQFVGVQILQIPGFGT